MTFEFLERQLLNGLTLAVVLTLVALGLSVIYGLMNILNMAHGAFVGIGAYCTVWTSEAGAGFWTGLLAAPIVVGALGYVVYVALVKRLRNELVLTMLATWGLALILQQTLLIAMGPAPRSVDGPFQGSLALLSIQYPAYRIFVIVAGILLFSATVWFYMRTTLGLQVRSAIMDQETASTLGINTARVQTTSFVFGSALAGLAGGLLAPLLAITPLVGLDYLVDAFFVVLVGGAGSVLGTGVGGLVVGGGQGVLELGLSALTAHIFVMCLSVLLVSIRPKGLVQKR